jgi:hypothetical protein
LIWLDLTIEIGGRKLLDVEQRAQIGGWRTSRGSRANEVAARIHDRMPVILPGSAEEELWLTGEPDDVLDLLRPIDASRIEYAPANPALNKVGGVREGPELLVAPAPSS